MSQGEVWLAAYTRPRFEFKVLQYLQERSIKAFLPTHRSWRTWSDRRKQVELPLFASYVFVGLTDLCQRHRALQAPGLLWFVHGRTGPVVVDPKELEGIRRLLASGLEYDPLPGAQVGDPVEIVKGVMRGCRGYLERKDSSAIVLQIAAVNGAIRVRLEDPGQIRVLPAPATPMDLQ